MATISGLALDFTSGSDNTNATVRVRYTLTVTGMELVHGASYEEELVLYARDFGLRANELGRNRPDRKVRLNTGVGIPNTFHLDNEGAHENFEVTWIQSNRSLAEDPDPPRFRNMDEFQVVLTLKPFAMPTLQAMADKDQNFG